MKFKTFLAAGTLAASGLLGATAAHAVTTWNFSYTGAGVTASGTFTTAGAALTPEAMLSISGVRNGVAITGLVPVGVDPDFAYDNEFTVASPNFTDGGIVFGQAGGNPNINVYFFNGAYQDLYIDSFGDPIETAISWTAAPVPEPATALTLLAGLGLLGVALRKSRAAV